MRGSPIRSSRVGLQTNLDIFIPLLISQSDFSLTLPFMSLTEKILTTNPDESFYCKVVSDYKRLNCNAFVKRRNYNIYHINIQKSVQPFSCLVILFSVRSVLYSV